MLILSDTSPYFAALFCLFMALMPNILAEMELFKLLLLF